MNSKKINAKYSIGGADTYSIKNTRVRCFSRDILTENLVGRCRLRRPTRLSNKKISRWRDYSVFWRYKQDTRLTKMYNNLMLTFSVIIPVKTKRDLCPELLSAIHAQSLPPLEILIITDKICPGNPASKRDYGASVAQGSVLAFLDADAYPINTWLKSATKLLSSPKLAAVCGPNLTPPNNSTSQQTSGLVWSSLLGAGGAGIYRNKVSSPRFVTDYPTSNLLVKRSDFRKINGFNTLFWPGEDTKLCHDLVYKLGKKILYHPTIQVFHHRRSIFLPHLQQISRFGFHRGLFAKILPKTSLKISYFIPSLFLIGLVIGPFISLHYYLLSLEIYLVLLIISALIHRSILLIPTLFLTHLVYGFFFLQGLLSPQYLSRHLTTRVD